MAVLGEIGSVVFNLLYNILTWLVVAVLLVGIFFASKYFGKWRKKKKSYTLEALIIKPDGNWLNDKLGFFDHPDKIDKLHFKTLGHTMPVIPNYLVRNNRVMLFNYGPKQYAVIPPSMWEKIDLKKFNIELINMQMKNFAFLEQRAAVSRWAYVKDLLTKAAPWITLILIFALTGIIAWFMMKFGTNMYNQVTGQRIAECSRILPQLIQQNITAPS